MLYQKQVNDSLNGFYDADLLVNHPSKLRLHIRNTNEKFARKFARKGHKWTFKDVDDDIDKESDRKANNKDDIFCWIRDFYRQSKGIELPGTVNPTLLDYVFRQQSEPWQNLTETYLEEVKGILDSFLDFSFPSIISDREVCVKLAGFLRPRVMEAYAKADEELRNLLRDEREGILQTVNNYLIDNIAETRHDRVMHRLKRAGFGESIGPQSISPLYITKAIHLSNEEQAVYDIHDIIKSFYKVAMKRYLDNVVVQVVERHLLGKEGPLRLLTPEFVADLYDDNLAFLAGENQCTANARAEMKAKLDRLRRARDIASGIPR
jgi:hypothetical protein